MTQSLALCLALLAPFLAVGEILGYPSRRLAVPMQTGLPILTARGFATFSGSAHLLLQQSVLPQHHPYLRRDGNAVEDTA